MSSIENSTSSDSVTIGDAILPTLKIIFSWMILMPIAVIVSGKFIAQRLKLNSIGRQSFRIPLVVLHIEAASDEVVFGFSGLLITLFIVAVFAGKTVYGLFKYQFGIDPGHFTSLLIFSSFATVVWSGVWFVLSKPKGGQPQNVRDEHERLINELSNK